MGGPRLKNGPHAARLRIAGANGGAYTLARVNWFRGPAGAKSMIQDVHYHQPCPVCGRPFAWRKKWEKVWDEVKYCSERCRRA